MTFIIVAANTLILIFAPADSENKRFTKKEKNLYRKKGLLLLAVCDFLYIGSLTNLFMCTFFPSSLQYFN